MKNNKDFSTYYRWGDFVNLLDILDKYSTLIGAIIGALLTYFFNKILQKDNLKQALEIRVFTERNQSIREIYQALTQLKEYYKLFLNAGYEFEKQEDYSKFSPLKKATEFREELKRREIFLKEDMRETLKKFACELGIGCSIALYLNNKNVPEANEEAVSSYCAKTVGEIEKLLEHLRKEIKNI